MKTHHIGTDGRGNYEFDNTKTIDRRERYSDRETGRAAARDLQHGAAKWFFDRPKGTPHRRP